LPRKGVIVYAGTSDWFRGKIDPVFIRAERPYIEQIFGIYCWNWKTWRQGRTHARIDQGRNYEKLWRVLDNFDASDTNMHSL